MGEGLNPALPTTTEQVLETVSAALNLLPAIGGTVADLLTTQIRGRQNDRLNRFCLALAEDLQRLRARLQQDFVPRQEMVDFTERVVDQVIHEQDQRVIDSIRAVFLNTCLSNHPNYDEAVEILGFISSSQVRHILLLKILADPLVASNDFFNGNVGGRSFFSIGRALQSLLPNWSREQIDRTWQDLYRTGLLNTPDTNVTMTPHGFDILAGRLTGFGEKVVSYISNP